MAAENLWSSAQAIPEPGDPQAAEAGMQRWIDAADRSGDRNLAKFAADATENAGARRFLNAIFGNSPFLGQCAIVDPDFSRLVFEEGPAIAFETALAALAKEAPCDAPPAELMRALRIARRRAALSIAAADIAGTWDDREVTERLSMFAETAIAAAVSALLYDGHQAGELDLPDPNEPASDSGFIVLGMGKLGAGELNYSSDIDLILLFDNECVPYAGKNTAQEYFVRLARRLVRMLEDRTGDGYVFRTDLRLRPDPGSTPPVLSALAAETYYESTGQNWERAAMIKAKPIAGDIEAGQRFLDLLRPFIWRRSLDFAAIEDIHSIKRQINAHRGGDAIKVAGHNLKLGRGGIREIEFFVQTQQLIWGGRDPTLRGRKTCETLRALVAAGHVEANAADDLESAYWFLRKLEHRLQMVDDQQTHQLPESTTRMEGFAAFLGIPRDELVATVSDVLHRVEHHYAALFEESPDLGGPGSLVFTGADDDPDTLRTLETFGFNDPPGVSAIVRTWHQGRYPALRSTRAKQLLTELMPALLGAFSRTHNPDAAFSGFNKFLSGLPAGVQLLSLFHTNPGLLELLAEIMGSAPTLAETLKQHPILFDAVLEADFFDPVPDAETLAKGLNAALKIKARDFQDVLDIIRRQVNDRMFQVGVHILRGRTTPGESGRALSDIADTALRSLYPAVETEFARAHGRMQSGGLAIVALGKLGGRELMLGSDLDLLFVYRGEEGSSDGKRPLTPTPYFTRLGQRFLSALTAPTAEGILYEVDLRLRPSGNAGPLATSLAAFRKYHQDDAWTWEHMALTRARVILADDDFATTLESAINDILAARRDADKLLRDVADMRARIERDRRTGGAWDVKNLRGGMVDIEFIAQYLQLRHAADHPEILAANTTDALARLKDRAILDPDTADTLIAGMHLWRNVQGVLRISVGDEFDETLATDDIRAMLARACRMDDFEMLKRTISDTGAACHAIYRALIEAPAAALAAET